MNLHFLQDRPSANSDLVDIKRNYRVLHHDEFPMLFTGNNRFDNIILGSHLDEDDEKKQIYTLYTIINDKEYYEFMQGKKSYYEILSKSNNIFFVVKDFGFRITQTYSISLSDLDSDYHPTPQSYCPKLYKQHSLTFSLRLKGKLADSGRAMADEVSALQQLFGSFLEDRIKALKGLNLYPQTLIQPYSEGSFKINFEVKVRSKSKKGGNLFLPESLIDRYITEFIQYVHSDFTKDTELYMSDNSSDVESPSFNNLKKTMASLYEESLTPQPANIDALLKDDIVKSSKKIESITEEVGEHFTSIAIEGVSDHQETPLGYVDEQFVQDFQSGVESILSAKAPITVDENFVDYQIYIYHLNTDNRGGNAFIRNLGDESEMSKPKIRINGTEPIEQTKYTESLHLNKWINIKGKARRIGNRFKFIEIDYESE